MLEEEAISNLGRIVPAEMRARMKALLTHRAELRRWLRSVEMQARQASWDREITAETIFDQLR